MRCSDSRRANTGEDAMFSVRLGVVTAVSANLIPIPIISATAGIGCRLIGGFVEGDGPVLAIGIPYQFAAYNYESGAPMIAASGLFANAIIIAAIVVIVKG